MRRRILVAISHPTIAAGVVDVLRLDPEVDVLRVTAEVAAERAREWHADLVLADATTARELRPVASIVMVTAAGDGIAARAVTQEIGAAGWLFIDDIDRQIDVYFGRASGGLAARTAQAVAASLALASVGSLAVALGLIWAALVP